MSVHRFLVTAPHHDKWTMWTATGPFANWLEGRDNGDGRETWLVTVFAEDADRFLDAARNTGVTVEEISGGGDSESYTLRVGEPGSGWADRGA
jgi:hypothetical protein